MRHFIGMGTVPMRHASIAQLVECYLGKVEVTGSIPVGSPILIIIVKNYIIYIVQNTTKIKSM